MSHIRYLRVAALSGLAVGLAGPITAAGALTPAPPGLIAGSPIGLTQLGGSNRFATAALVAERSFPYGATTAVVVSGADANLADTLAASYVAGVQDAPILLVNPTSVPSETTGALATLGSTHVVIVGGTASVSAAVATALSDGGKVLVTQIGSPDRFLTADEADAKAGLGMGPKVGTVAGKSYAIVADGQDQDLADALGAAPIADAGPFPVFLVNGATGGLSSTDLSVMTSEHITDAVIVGGTAAVGAQVGTQLSGANINPIREAGPNRSATSVALADFAIQTLGFSTDHFNIASGDQAHLVDSLAGGPLGGAQRAPTLVTASVDDAGPVVGFVSAHASTETTADLFGGLNSVSPVAVAAIASPVGPPLSSGTATPVSGTAAAESAAASLLARATVPPGSVAVASPPTASPPSSTLDQPAQRPVCSPLVDDAGYWVAPGSTAAAVSAYLQSHLSPGTTLGITGSGGTTGAPVAYYVVTESSTTQVGQGASLVFTLANLGNSAAGIRADAQVIPSGAGCLSGGGSSNGSSIPAG